MDIRDESRIGRWLKILLGVEISGDEKALTSRKTLSNDVIKGMKC